MIYKNIVDLVRPEHLSALNDLKRRLVKVYPGFIYVRITTREHSTVFGMSYSRNGVLMASEVDVPAKKWGYYSGVEDFYAKHLRDGIWRILEKKLPCEA